MFSPGARSPVLNTIALLCGAARINVVVERLHTRVIGSHLTWTEKAVEALKTGFRATRTTLIHQVGHHAFLRKGFDSCWKL